MTNSGTNWIIKARYLWLCRVAVGLIALWVSNTAAADGGPDYFAVTGVAAGEVLNIHAEPSTGGEKIGEIPHDSRRVQTLVCIGYPGFAEWQKMTEAELKRASHHYWCKVRYRGTEGWVAGRFLKEDSG